MTSRKTYEHLQFGDAAGGVQRLHLGARRRGSSQSGKKLPRLKYSSGEALRLWDGQSDDAHLGGEQTLAVAIAVGGSNGSGGLGFQRIPVAPAHDLRDQGASCGALYELSQVGGATVGECHGLRSVWWKISKQGHRPAHPLPQHKSEPRVQRLCPCA